MRKEMHNDIIEVKKMDELSYNIQTSCSLKLHFRILGNDKGRKEIL